MMGRVDLVHLVSNKYTSKPEQPASRTAASGIGGGFQHRLVDSHHGYLHRVMRRHHFAGETKPLPHSHTGTRIALQVGQEHVSRP